MRAPKIFGRLGGIAMLSMISLLTHAAVIKGKVLDTSQEPLIGAYVILQGHAQNTATGLDGSFHLTGITPGTYTLLFSFIGYTPQEKTIIVTSDSDVIVVPISMVPDVHQLSELIITGDVMKGTDAQARLIERNSPNTMNIVSSRAIALSPDVSVANVVQRVSGLTVERSSNGDPQYALVRGMDKRYGYTLVNGVKIPSPDNKNRYVPLDIFPATLLERLEVYKSLTADMEGDAMGGAVNLVMKGAAEAPEVRGDLQIGYNQINVLRGFDKFNAKSIRDQSPAERYGPNYQAQPGDFTKLNGNTRNISPMPDVLGSVSLSRRFINNRLGVMAGGSVQNSFRGSESVWFETETDRFGSNLPAIGNVEEHHYSIHQWRTAAHTRIDYRFNPQHSLSLYTGYYVLNNQEARETNTTYLDGRNFSSSEGNAILSYSTRTRVINQSILNNTLQGTHRLFKPLTLDWSAVASTATNERPDNLRFDRNGELKNFVAQPITVERRSPRQWERNKDTDYTGYINLTLTPLQNSPFTIRTGAMLRDKQRTNYFNRYLFDPDPSPQILGRDWTQFSEVTWQVINPAGSATNELNYKAHERIFAAYALARWHTGKTEWNAGVRVEQTRQGYTLLFPNTNQTPDSTQRYTDVLPSISIKHKANEHMNVRLTYYRALSRPGFFEIVPYVNEQDGFDEEGNTKLKRATGDNIDLRWEYFPSITDQLLIGVFYKTLRNPIEYAVVLDGVNNEQVIKPGNYGTAYNLGAELDFTKYFSAFGIRGNYTYTHSRITTTKAVNTRVDPTDPSSALTVINRDQSRPLQGQANHIGNISLLYRQASRGIEAQLSLVYTGERLETISPYLNNDTYVAAIAQVDVSAEKRLGKHIEVFVKVTNLLNAPYKTFIRQPVLMPDGDNVYPYQEDAANKTMVRRDRYYQSGRIGIRIQFNKAS